MTEVKESLMVALFKTFLCGHLQECLLEEDSESECDMARTILQYLIEVVCLVNDKALAKVIYGFLFNKPEVLSTLYNKS